MAASEKGEGGWHVVLGPLLFPQSLENGFSEGYARITEKQKNQREAGIRQNDGDSEKISGGQGFWRRREGQAGGAWVNVQAGEGLCVTV